MCGSMCVVVCGLGGGEAQKTQDSFARLVLAERRTVKRERDASLAAGQTEGRKESTMRVGAFGVFYIDLPHRCSTYLSGCRPSLSRRCFCGGCVCVCLCGMKGSGG